MRCFWLATALVLAGSGARADTGHLDDGGADYVPAPHTRDIVIVTPGERSATNIAMLASLAGGAVVLGGLGVYFNLDSQSAAHQVSATDATNQPWTQALQDTYDRAHSSGVKAAVCYGVGGALLVASAVALIVTEPKSETTVIHPHVGGAPMPTLAPTPGGAMLGGVWRF